MKVHHLCWLALPVLVGGASYFAASGQLQRAWAAAFALHPVIDYPAQIDLGEREVGDMVVVPITIANRGGGELVLDRIQTNCSCSGLEREGEGGEALRVESLRLGAHEQARLSMRVAVRGVANGSAMTNRVMFRTNDPTRPEETIEATVPRAWRGIACYPPSVALGAVPVGAKVSQVVDVRDTAKPPRTIERLTCTDPDHVKLRLLPIPEGHREERRHPDGALIARVEVVVSTGRPREVAATAEIHLAGGTRPPDGVMVSGRVTEPIEIGPPSLLLPRSSAEGPIYTASCVCKSEDGQRLTVETERAPAGLTAEVTHGESPSVRVVRVRWDPASGKSLAGGRHIIRLRAKAGQADVALHLPVLIRE